MSKFIETCEQAARAGGRVLLDWQNRFKSTEKGPRDLVTEADFASQKAIADIILGRFPDHQFLGEEDPTQQQRTVSQQNSPYRWIVDPLDGTTNYVHGLPNFAVSIALEFEGDLIAGVVFDPILQECFSAEAGKGARLNGQKIRVSDCEHMGSALLAASFSPNVQRDSLEVQRFVEVLGECQAVRRLGSCALNLCYLACGRLDGYWATSVKVWDVAAGFLILNEAGGELSSIDGQPVELDSPRFIGAATETLHKELFQQLSRVGRTK